MTEWQFYGRTEPLSELRRIVNSGRWFFCRLEGRRRIGKTSLLSHLSKRDTSLSERLIYMQVPDSDERDVATAFRRALSECDHHLARSLSGTVVDFPSMAHAIGNLCHEGLVVVIDEFQYFTRAALKSFNSFLQAEVDQLRDANALLMFVGEAPGAEEDKQGVPFVGAAGQLLNNLLSKLGLRREEVYIANIIKSRPPGNRDPEADEIAACLPFLEKQIKAIRPRVIVTLGRIATHALLGTKEPLTRPRGHWQRYHDIRVMPTFHPSYLLRAPQERRKTWDDMQQVMEYLAEHRET